MRQLKLFRWTAVLMLAIALAPGAASAKEDGTITISSAFTMDWLDGTVGDDLAEVFANGHEHTWTLSKPPPARHRPGARSARRPRCPNHCFAGQPGETNPSARFQS